MTSGQHPAALPSKLARALGTNHPAGPAVPPKPTRKGPASAVLGAYMQAQVRALKTHDPGVREDQLVIVLTNSNNSKGPTLLLAALQVWVTNVIALPWFTGNGTGLVARRHTPRHELPRADFRFPQDEDHDAVKEVAARSSVKTGWTASFIDYVYFSLSNSMAFSPTDTMPLSARAKSLMGMEAFGGFVLLALVIAHAVSLLGQ
ncbi:hypothetical protein [Pseudarthrobacter sp. S9]|uniref:hypothetical protein n=1 Tax=Pseudarthrobacter sp. S9 TaxID=3418421 RepID=UPI003CFD9FCA